MTARDPATPRSRIVLALVFLAAMQPWRPGVLGDLRARVDVAVADGAERIAEASNSAQGVGT